MRSQSRISSAAGLLASVVIVGLGASTARAQFPVFYGGQVLTPFGNRRSDGSYRPPAMRAYPTSAAYRPTVPAARYAPVARRQFATTATHDAVPRRRVFRNRPW